MWYDIKIQTYTTIRWNKSKDKIKGDNMITYDNIIISYNNNNDNNNRKIIKKWHQCWQLTTPIYNHDPMV